MFFIIKAARDIAPSSLSTSSAFTFMAELGLLNLLYTIVIFYLEEELFRVSSYNFGSSLGINVNLRVCNDFFSC